MILTSPRAQKSPSSDGDSVIFVTLQTDHAWLAGELLRLFQEPDLRHGHPRFAALLEATRRHDDGWRGFDAVPHLHPSGRRPHDFRSLPLNEREEVWLRTCEELEPKASQATWSDPQAADSSAAGPLNPWAAALILHHALTLHGGGSYQAGGPAPEAWVLSLPLLERLTAARDQLIAAADLVPEGRTNLDLLLEDYRWLALVDWLSLVTCMAQEGPFSWGAWQGTIHVEAAAKTDRDGAEVTVLAIEPFPLAGTTSLRFPARALMGRAFETPRELSLALARQPFIRRTVRVEAMDRSIQTSVS